MRQSKRSESGIGKSNQSVSPHSLLCSAKKDFRTRIVTSSRVLYGESKNWVQDFNGGSPVSYAQMVSRNTSGIKNSASIDVKVLKVSPRHKHVNQVNKPQVARQESTTKTFSNVQNLAKNKNYNKSSSGCRNTSVKSTHKGDVSIIRCQNKFTPLQNLGDADCTNTNALCEENVKVSDNITRNVARNTKITKGHSNDGPKVASDTSIMIKSNTRGWSFRNKQ